MKGLLLKEFYSHRKFYYISEALLSLITVLLFSPDTETTVFCFILASYGMTVVAYSIRSIKFNVYNLIFPFTKSQLVSAKFIMGLLNFALFFFPPAVFGLPAALLTSAFPVKQYAFILACIAAIILITNALLLFILFKDPLHLPVAGLIIYFFLFLVPFIYIPYYYSEYGLTLSAIPIGVSITVFTAAFVLYGVFWLLSIYFYKKSRFDYEKLNSEAK